jgi:hypothetical protein
MPVHYTIKDIQQYALERGGKCLSKEYWDDISRLMWMCDKGHVWELPWRFIKLGAWCPTCAKEQEKLEKKKERILKRNKTRTEELIKLATEKGGAFLSGEFIGDAINLRFRCANGHEWENNYFRVMRGRWCPVCLKDKTKDRRLEKLKKIAIERGGQCLSDKYVNKTTKLQFRCAAGHQWFTIPEGISRGKWCPKCSIKKGFEKRKPTIEIYKKIAAEKGGKCLSDVYINGTTKLEWQCGKGHIWKAISKYARSNWCPVCGIKQGQEKRRNDIEIYRQIASERGGKLLSQEYTNGKIPLLWECAKGHQWYTAAGNVKNQKTWCPYCLGKHQTIEEMREIAAQRGGKCLSEKYEGGHGLLLWECKNGHQWRARATSVRNRGSWCFKCYHKGKGELRKDTIEMYQKIAEERGGRLLSLKYINSSAPLLWECKNGHQWEASPSSIKNAKTWCRVCRMKNAHEKRKLSIEIYQKIAIEKGGRLLSQQYINASTDMLWECNKGHQWSNTGYEVKGKHQWCPQCRKENRKKL